LDTVLKDIRLCLKLVSMSMDRKLQCEKLYFESRTVAAHRVMGASQLWPAANVPVYTLSAAQCAIGPPR
jgi:hypothetical protein